MPHLKLTKNEKQTKIAIHMDLWKYGQILTIQKSLIIKRLSFFLYKIPHMNLSFCITLPIEY
jgi:hypothetical protein